jgi:hypothetical protein
MDILELLGQIETFKAGSLTRQVGAIERQLVDAPSSEIQAMLGQHQVNGRLFQAALTVKRLSAQIDVVVHAVGILYALPFILAQDEVVQSLSLGAGNAGSEFDLVTSHQIAEFKFIHWRPSGNAIRNKTLFKDFYKLACADTTKKKNLYLLETGRPLHFLTGKRMIEKVLDRSPSHQADFRQRFGDGFITVGDFYAAHQGEVNLVDLSQLLPEPSLLAIFTE